MNSLTFSKYAHLLSCREPDEKINTTLTSEYGATASGGLALH